MSKVKPKAQEISEIIKKVYDEANSQNEFIVNLDKNGIKTVWQKENVVFVRESDDFHIRDVRVAKYLNDDKFLKNNLILHFSKGEEIKEETRFNKAQQEAIEHKDGPLMVLAGPGSGKTTVIVNRTKNLIEKHHVDPHSILVTTFTKDSAEEMRQRFDKLTDYKYSGIFFGTIHSLCMRILVLFFGYKYEQIIQDLEKRKILSRIIKENHLNSSEEEDLIDKIISMISWNKNRTPDERDFSNFVLSEGKTEFIFNEYERNLHMLQKIDFEDMLNICYQLLIQFPAVVEYLQDTYHYFMIDEFQDTNLVQAKIFYLLADKEKNIVIVGDDDQSLYQFRGARPEIMLNFEEDFPNAKIITLNTNYRSDANIVNASKKFIEKNSSRYKKDLKPFHEAKNKIILNKFMTEKEQAQNIIKMIREHYEKGIPYSEMSVIYRTNAESHVIMTQFMVNKIPFRASSKDIINIYNHIAFRDIINILKLSDGSAKSYQSYMKAMRRPSCFIPNEAWKSCKSIEEVKAWARDHKKMYIVNNIDRIEMQLMHINSIKDFQKQLDYILHYYGCNNQGYKKGLEDYYEFREEGKETGLEFLSMLIDDSKDYGNYKEWVQHAEEYTKMLKQTKKIDMDDNAVNLNTMHSSKGLEYEVVFIINANDGITPYKKAKTREDFEEERRMFYVAITRAKNYLYVSEAKFHKGEYYPVSDYYKEIREVV